MKTTKVRRPLRLVEETRNCGDELAGYFVHDPNTGADATVADDDGNNITEFHAVKRWVAEHFPGEDVRG